MSNHETHKKLHVNLKNELHKKLKVVCALNGLSIKEYVEILIEKEFEKFENAIDTILSNSIVKK